jgi:hypothetical protein
MRIDFQIPAHLRQQVGTDLLLSILEGGEFFAEIQPSMASFSLVGHELAGDLPAPSEPPQPALEFCALHGSMFGQLCPTGQGRGDWMAAGGEGNTRAIRCGADRIWVASPATSAVCFSAK